MRTPARLACIAAALIAAALIAAGCATAVTETSASQPTAAEVRPEAAGPSIWPNDIVVAGDGESAALARIDHELAALEPLIREAERQAARDARVRFEYAWLRNDLGRMRAGIHEHLSAPRREPRRVEPLRADYRR